MGSGGSEAPETKTQSYRGPGTSPRFHEGVARIVSWYMPVVVDGFEGAQKMARAEWKTLRRSTCEISMRGGCVGDGAASGSSSG